MGLNSEHAQAGWIVFDLETRARPEAAAYLPEPQADKRLTDPAKIEADRARKREEAIARLALDLNGAAIAALGYQTESDPAPVVWTEAATDMTAALRQFWQLTKRRRIIGFCLRTFDLPMVIQASRYAGIAVPAWREFVAPYGRARGVVDLFDELTFDNSRQDGVIPRTLGTFCRLFGLDVPDDPHDGKDIAALLAAEDWDAVAAHCRCDVAQTVALARRLGILPAQVTAEAVGF